MSYAEEFKKLWKEEEQEQSRVWDRQLNPWETVLGKAYLRIVGEVENALEMNRQGAFMAADLVLQRGLLAAEKILTKKPRFTMAFSSVFITDITRSSNI